MVSPHLNFNVLRHTWYVHYISFLSIGFRWFSFLKHRHFASRLADTAEVWMLADLEGHLPYIHTYYVQSIRVIHLHDLLTSQGTYCASQGFETPYRVGWSSKHIIRRRYGRYQWVDLAEGSFMVPSYMGEYVIPTTFLGGVVVCAQDCFFLRRLGLMDNESLWRQHQLSIKPWPMACKTSGPVLGRWFILVNRDVSSPNIGTHSTGTLLIGCPQGCKHWCPFPIGWLINRSFLPL